jgi:replicative DNA helicase Mcm
MSATMKKIKNYYYGGNVSVEKIYNLFENTRKNNKTYKEAKYNKESEYKELIKLLLDCGELNEAELILKASNGGLGKLYYNAFISIMKKHLGFIDYGEKEGFKTIKTTNELKEALQEQTREVQKDEWNELIIKYETYIKQYIKELVSEENTGNKIKISLKELYNAGLMEFIDYAIENYEKVQDYLKDMYDDYYFELFEEINTKQLILWDFPNKAINRIDINDLDINHINKIVEFEANIIYASEIVAILKKSIYTCSNCGTEKEIFYKDIFENPIKPECKCNNAMIEQTDKNTYANFQEITAQSVNINGTTKERKILYEDTNGVYEGNIKVVGYVRVASNSKKTERYKKLVIQAIHIEPINEVSIKLTDEDINDIKKVSKHPNVVKILSNQLLSKIKGYDTIKEAIFLQQIKGLCEDDIRGNIHILLITDPAIGKSVMLRKIAKINNNNYVNMPTSTTTSLTAIAEKKSTILGEQWTLKAGVIARTRGTISIDEFYIPKQDKTLLEPMESQTINIDKGGIHATLKGDCAYLCACNPKYGKFDPNISIIEQINIDAPTLSRFDIIFPIKDDVDKNKDLEVARQIRKNRKINKKTDKTDIEGVLIDDDFIFKYIEYARQIKPELTDKAGTQADNYYIEMRQNVKNYTARQHEAVIRIAEAHAKARLSDKVEPQDTEEAIRIMTEALKDIATDGEGMDIGKITGITEQERKRISIILNTIKENSKNTELVDYTTIVEYATEQGLTEEQTEATLNKLINRGDIDEPRSGKYRII